MDPSASPMVDRCGIAKPDPLISNSRLRVGCSSPARPKVGYTTLRVPFAVLTTMLPALSVAYGALMLVVMLTYCTSHNVLTRHFCPSLRGNGKNRSCNDTLMSLML